MRDRGEKRQTALSLFNLQTWILINPIYPKVVIYPNELYLQIRKHASACSWLLLTNASKQKQSIRKRRESYRVYVFSLRQLCAWKQLAVTLAPASLSFCPSPNLCVYSPSRTSVGMCLPPLPYRSRISHRSLFPLFFLKQKYSRLEENPSQGLYLFACMPPRSNPARRKHQQSETTSLFVSDL